MTACTEVPNNEAVTVKLLIKLVGFVSILSLGQHVYCSLPAPQKQVRMIRLSVCLRVSYSVLSCS